MTLVATGQFTIIDVNDAIFVPNILKWYEQWTVGSSLITGWTIYGDAAENVRASLVDPFGFKSTIWRCVPDADGGASGGFTVVPEPIDPAKLYRYTCFVKRVGDGVGTIEHGCGGVKTMAGSFTTTGIFYDSSTLNIGEWYLLVGFIHPETETIAIGKSGIYSMSGRLLAAGNEYKFASGVTPTFFTRLTGGVNAVSEYQLFNPTFECIDGTEETIADLVHYDASEFDYLTEVLKHGETTIEGGLLITNLIQAAGMDKVVRSGMSGLAEDNIGFWTGGSYQDALSEKASNIIHKDGSIRLGGGALTYDKADNKFALGDFRILNGEIIGLDSNSKERVRMSRSALPDIGSISQGWAYFSEGIIGDHPAMIVGDEVKHLPSDKWVFANRVGTLDIYKPFTLEKTIVVAAPSQLRLEDVQMEAWIYNVDPEASTITATWGIYNATTGVIVYPSGGPVSTSIPITIEAAGTYKLKVNLNPRITNGEPESLDPFQKVFFEASFRCSAISFQGTHARSMIGQDGIMSWFTGASYLYYKEAYGFEARFGSMGIRITSQGIEKMINGTTWTADTVTNEGTITATTYNNHVLSNLHLTQGQRDVLAMMSVVDGYLKVTGNMYATGSVSAQGIGGSGGGGTSYNRLDTWDAYISGTTDTWVLSALLGHDLHTRVTALEEDTPNVAWGVPTTDYVPLTVNAISRQLSVHGHGHTFASLASKPTTIAGYGITDSLIYEGDARLTNSRPASDVQPWAKAASKPSYSYTEVGAAAASHAHGNITSDGKIGTTANLVVVTGTAGALTAKTAGTTAQYLRGDGSWATPPDTIYVHPTKTSRNVGGASHFITAFTSDSLGHVTGITTAAMAKADVEAVLVGNSITSHYHDDRYFQKGELFTKEGSGTEADPYRIRANFPFYGVSSVAALGIGSGGGGAAYDRLDAWLDYTADKAGWVLSAALGYDLHGRVSTLESSTPNVSWGVAGAGYIPLAVNGVSHQLSTYGHTHTKSSITDFAHTHDDRYYTETEVNTLLANKANWDTAYGWGNHASAGYALNSNLTSHTGNNANPHGVTYGQVGAAASSHTHTKSQITDFPSSLPASDVYAWAKASTKPSYHAGELGVTPTSYKVTSVAAGIAPYIPDVGTNIFSGATTSELTVERSEDDGATWVDVTGTEAANIKNIFSGCVQGNMPISNRATAVVGDKLRITFNPSGNSRYCQLAFIYIYFNTNGSGVTCNIEKNLYTNPASWSPFVADAPVAGWPGPNIIGMGSTTFGQGDSRNQGYGIRMTFRINSVNASYNSKGYILSISGFTGNKAWGTPSGNSIAKTNTPYTIHNSDRAVIFDNTIKACNNVNGSNYTNAAITAYEVLYGGAQTDNWSTAPRIAWVWTGRSAASIALASSGHLYYKSSDEAISAKLVYESGTWAIGISGNASTATKLQTTRALTVGLTGKNFDGSANVSWSLAEIGAASVAGSSTQDFSVKNLTVAGTASVTGLLTATGNIATANVDGSYVQIGSLRLIAVDATTLKLETATGGAANFYATGSNSAQGIGTGGGGASYNMVSDWSQYVSGSELWVVSAELINALRTSVTSHIGDSTHASAGEKSNWNASYSHSLVTGGVHMTSTDRSQLTTAYNHSQTAHQTIINGTGFVKASGTTLSYDSNTYLTSITKAQVEAALTGDISTHTHDGRYYTESEINTKLTDGSVTKLGTATVGATNRPIYLNAGVATATSVGEAFLSWGGQNFSQGYSPVDAAMVPALGANRLAFAKPEGIIVEYSRDGGVTWLDYGSSDGSKVSLFSGLNAGYIIGKADNANKATALYKLRVTINTSAARIYTVLNKFVLYISTNGSTGTTCTITARLQSNYTSNRDTWQTFANQVGIRGWSGYNVINISGFTTYGNVPASHYGQVRFLFEATGGSTTYNGLRVERIYGFGGVGWTAPSNMASIGSLFTYGWDQSAYFPANVSATAFKEGSTLLSDKYAAIAQTHYVGTTAISANRTSGAQALTGITSIDGSASKLTTPRALTIGSTAKNFDGSAAVSWSLAEIGAMSASATTDSVNEGTTNYYFTASRVLGVNLSTVTPANTALAANIPISTAMNRIQGQINARALLAGASTQDFATKNLSVTGTVTATGAIKGSKLYSGYNYTTQTAGFGFGTDGLNNGAVFYAGTDTSGRIYRDANIMYFVRGISATGGFSMNSVGAVTFNQAVETKALLTATGNIATANVDGAYVQIGPIKILYDATNNALRFEGNVYATGSSTAFGVGGGAGGGGLITNVYGASGFGGTYSDVDLSSTFNAYAINSLYTALQGKQDTITGAVSTLVSSNLNPNYALVSGATGKIQASGVTATELSYLSGVTSAVQYQIGSLQTQINAKPSVNSYPTAFSWSAGTTSGPTATISGSNMTAISVAAIPEASATASGIVTTGSQTFAGEKWFASSVRLAGSNALVLDGATQYIYSHEQGEAIMTFDNGQPKVVHHWASTFEYGIAGSLDIKMGTALTFGLDTMPSGAIRFANGASGNESPVIIGKSTSVSTGTGLSLCAGTSETNNMGDMTYNVRRNTGTDFTDTTKVAFRWGRYVTNLMTLARNGLFTLMPATNSLPGASQAAYTHAFSLNAANIPTYSTRRTDSGMGMIIMSMTADNNTGGADMMFNVRNAANTDYSASYRTKVAFRWDRYGDTLMSLTRGGKLTANEYAVSALASAPASASAAGTTGEIRFTGVGIFICIATNTWRKATISTF